MFSTNVCCVFVVLSIYTVQMNRSPRMIFILLHSNWNSWEPDNYLGEQGHAFMMRIPANSQWFEGAWGDISEDVNDWKKDPFFGTEIKNCCSGSAPTSRRRSHCLPRDRVGVRKIS